MIHAFVSDRPMVDEVSNCDAICCGAAPLVMLWTAHPPGT